MAVDKELEGLEKFAKSAGLAIEQLANKTKVAEGQLSSITIGAGDLSKAFGASTQMIEGMAQAIPVLGSALGPTVDYMGRLITSIMGVTEAAASLINNVQKMAFAYDKMATQTMVAFGKSFEDAKKTFDGFSKAVLDTREVTFESLGDIEKQSKELGKFFTTEELISTEPFIEASKEITGVSDKINILTATSLVGKAVGMDYASATQTVAEMMDSLVSASATSTQKIEESQSAMLAMSSVARDTGVNINIVGSQLIDSAKQLAIYRTEGTTATEVMGNLASATTSFTRALTETGMAGPAAVRFAKQFTDQMRQVNIATRAFVAQSAAMGRGQGALGAALRFERAIGEGRFEEIQQAIGQMVRRVGGGRIMTFQQAVNNDIPTGR
jgi:hypothetical protein